MKKILTLFIIVVLATVSCSDKDENKELTKLKNKRDEINKIITEKETELEEINERIAVLDKSANNNISLVKVEKLKLKEFEHFTDVQGSVEAVKQVFVSPEVGGQIVRIFVKEGDNVRKGQILAKLNSSVVSNSIAQVKTNLNLATTMYQKQKMLWDKKIGSEIQYLQAKSNMESLESQLASMQSQMNMSNITAPISGVIDKVMQKEGELAAPGMGIMQLVNLNQIYINAELSEYYINNVKKGDEVFVEFPSNERENQKAVIRNTSNIINPENRTFKIQLLLNNKNKEIKPNMLSKIKIRDFYEKNVIIVPSNVLKRDSKGTYLFVVEKNAKKNIAKKVFVEVGKTADEKTYIKKGLNEGDLVIIDGHSKVRDGVGVKIVE